MNDEQGTVMEGHRAGRQALIDWVDAQPKDAYEADRHLRAILPLYVEQADRLASLQEDLSRFGKLVATEIDAQVRENNRQGNEPQLERFDGIGRRVEAIRHHPSYHEAGRGIYGSNVMAAYDEHPNTVGVLARMYVSSTNGEAGHNCPLACTAGVIRVLQELGDEETKGRYLPGLLNPTYGEHLEGAQFLTEIQGGSDVGKNATVARQAGDGSWEIWGEKWFCSNIDADLFLMTARPEGASGGTRGLGLFLVPRRLEDGSTNEFYVRRLKEKIGTRSMASGECDFRGARAWHMGELGEGFRHMMELVITTSRLFNAAACAGLARRAYVVAQTYARHREAFGQPIGDYPLVQETLADMKAELDAMVSSSFYLARMQDRIDAGEASPQQRAFQRMAINLNKIRTAVSARELATQGIEVLGGNGAIETFSVLPRLLRDSIVTENWEGTHNTLIMQILRDMGRYRVHEGFFAELEDLLESSGDDALKRALAQKLAGVRAEVARVLDQEPGRASLSMRRLIEPLASLFYGAVQVWEQAQLGDDEASDEARATLAQFLNRRLEIDGDEALTALSGADYLERIALVASAL